MHIKRILSAMTLALAGASSVVAQNSKRMGFSPEDQKRFDEAVAAGDFYLYLGIGLAVGGIAIFVIGIAYQIMKKKKPANR